MGNRPTSSEILHLAHHAACDARLWDEVAKLLRLRLEAAYVGFVEHNFVTRQGQIAHASGFSPEFTDLYAERFAAQNAWLRAECEHAPGRAFTGAELVPNWELVRTDFYKRWLRPQDAFHCLMGFVRRRSEDVRCVIALRPLEAVAFGAEEKRVLSMLLPQLGCASELGSRIASVVRRSNVLEDVLGCLPEAVFIVDADSKILLANRSAATLLEQKDGLVRSRGLLGTSTPAETTELRRLVARAAAAQSGNGDGGDEIAVSRPSGELPIVLTVMPLGHAALDETDRPTNVAVAITRPLEHAVAARRLCDFYRMTPAEARLAALIAGGRTLAAAATELHITTNTARTHMKRIYSKTVTHRQADLVRLLTSGYVQFH